MDITMESGCRRTVDPEMVLSSIPGLDATMAPGGCTAILIGITPATKWPSDHSMARGAAEIMGICPVFDEP